MSASSAPTPNPIPTPTAREAHVTAGLVELEQWLFDLVRQGLATLQDQPYSFWENMAARMVDAQAPGVARLLRRMATLPAHQPDWPEKLITHLGRLYLLLQGFHHLPDQPPTRQADIRATIGWTIRRQDLLAQSGQTDQWLVLGQRTTSEDRLRTQRTWLWGINSRQNALILQYAHGRQPFRRRLIPGVSFQAELIFYPGAYPLRAIIRSDHLQTDPLDQLPGHHSLEAALVAYAVALAANPWLEIFPLTLENIIPTRQGESWSVLDSQQRQLPLDRYFDQGWALLALSGGHPLTLFGEWDGWVFYPLSVWAEARFVPLERLTNGQPETKLKQ